MEQMNSSLIILAAKCKYPGSITSSEGNQN